MGSLCQTTPLPDDTAARKCRALRPDDLYQKRPHVRVYRPQCIQKEMEGANNKVTRVVISQPCSAPRAAVREAKKHTLSTSEIVRAVTLGAQKIGPAIYAVTTSQIYMDMYDMNAREYIFSPSLTPRHAKSFSTSVLGLLRKLADLGMFCRDTKPLNVVVRVGPRHVPTSVKLIDFEDCTAVRHDVITTPKNLFDAYFFVMAVPDRDPVGRDVAGSVEQVVGGETGEGVDFIRFRTLVGEIKGGGGMSQEPDEERVDPLGHGTYHGFMF